MEPGRPSKTEVHPAFAAFLAALFPGLGQFYNGQWAKGAVIFFGAVLLISALLSSVDMDRFAQALLADEVPPNLGLLLSLSAVLLFLAIWSIVDAVRVAGRARRSDRLAKQTPHEGR